MVSRWITTLARTQWSVEVHAEATTGLYKTEAVRDDSPFRRGPLHRLGRIPPAEYQAIYYATNTARSEAATRNHVHRTWAVQSLHTV